MYKLKEICSQRKTNNTLVIDANRLLTKYSTNTLSSKNLKCFLAKLRQWMETNKIFDIYIWCNGDIKELTNLLRSSSLISEILVFPDLIHFHTLWKISSIAMEMGASEKKGHNLNTIIYPPLQPSGIPFSTTPCVWTVWAYLHWNNWRRYHRLTKFRPKSYSDKLMNEIFDLENDEFYLKENHYIKYKWQHRVKSSMAILELKASDFLTGRLHLPKDLCIKYKWESCLAPIKEIALPALHKKLLVLDINNTIVDWEPEGLIGIVFVRPYLHEFLTTVSKHYNIAFWSDTYSETTNLQLKYLNISNNNNYDLVFLLSIQEMYPVHMSKLGPAMVKALERIWYQRKVFSARNTIMIDNDKKYFAMNPQSGLIIDSYNVKVGEIKNDRVLKDLALYLEMISDVEDFQTLDHQCWRQYCKSRKKI